ncbi:MAG: hypothetical protein QHH17_06825 [Candidatus Bathyarchaeota archaeon]|nr:hypothetical protein [Candidatus Bathyarchaeota archaeon]
MSKEEKLEKVILICDKKKASVEEIFEGCATVFPALVKLNPKEDQKKGLISCSQTNAGHLAVCVWIHNAESDKQERIAHFRLSPMNTAAFKGFLNHINQINLRG